MPTKSKINQGNPPLFKAILARNSKDVATSGCLDPNNASLSCNALSCKGSASLSLPFTQQNEEAIDANDCRTGQRQLEFSFG